MKKSKGLQEKILMKLSRHALADLVRKNSLGTTFDEREPFIHATLNTIVNHHIYVGHGFAKCNHTKIEVKKPSTYVLEDAIAAIEHVMTKHDKGSYVLDATLNDLKSLRASNAKHSRYVADRWNPKRGRKIAEGRAVVDIVKQIIKDIEAEQPELADEPCSEREPGC
jgi:hypothetical protein